MFSQQTGFAELHHRKRKKEKQSVPTNSIINQHKGGEKTYHPALPIPITESGLQVNPTRTFKSWSTIPKRPSRADAELLPADWTVSQHWIEPVLQELEGGEPVGVAAATLARARKATLENFMVGL